MSGQPQDTDALSPRKSTYVCGTGRKVSTKPGVGTMEEVVETPAPAGHRAPDNQFAAYQNTSKCSVTSQADCLNARLQASSLKSQTVYNVRRRTRFLRS